MAGRNRSNCNYNSPLTAPCDFEACQAANCKKLNSLSLSLSLFLFTLYVFLTAITHSIIRSSQFFSLAPLSESSVVQVPFHFALETPPGTDRKSREVHTKAKCSLHKNTERERERESNKHTHKKKA